MRHEIELYFSLRMNALERNGWFGPLDKIFVPKREWREIPELGMETALEDEGVRPTRPAAISYDVIDSKGNPSLSSAIGSAMLFSSG